MQILFISKVKLLLDWKSQSHVCALEVSPSHLCKVAYWAMIDFQTSWIVTNSCLHVHIWNLNSRWAKRIFPPSADECENSAPTSFCTVKLQIPSSNKWNIFLSGGGGGRMQQIFTTRNVSVSVRAPALPGQIEANETSWGSTHSHFWLTGFIIKACDHMCLCVR